MNKVTYNVIGVMSGTSLDGIDLCYVNFNFNDGWTFKILDARTIKYPNLWKKLLRNSISLEKDDLCKLDREYTNFLSDTIQNFINDTSIEHLDLICSHGHTVFHQPDKGITKQIGNLSLMAQKLSMKVVCDFRVEDVELGGQGAPLVPMGDKLLFSEFDLCLNLGGFANISFDDHEGNRIAFDICPVNIVLNHYANKQGFEYDYEGEMASKGNINIELLNELNNLKYYSEKFPKSLGLEWVKNEVFPLIDSFNMSVEDILATCVEHVAFQINKVLNDMPNSDVLVTGGGAYNLFLINKLSTYSKSKIKIPSNQIIDFKEALIFGLLGVLRYRNEVNCLKSVTGARFDHSSGKIYEP